MNKTSHFLQQQSVPTGLRTTRMAADAQMAQPIWAALLHDVSYRFENLDCRSVSGRLKT